MDPLRIEGKSVLDWLHTATIYSYVAIWIFSVGCGNEIELRRVFFEDRCDKSDTIDIEFKRWVLTIQVDR